MAHGHHNEIDPAELDRKFDFDGGTKKILSYIIGTGVIMLILGIIIAISQEKNIGKTDAHGHGGHGKAHSEAITPKSNAHEAQLHIAKVANSEVEKAAKEEAKTDAKADEAKGENPDTHATEAGAAHETAKAESHGNSHGNSHGAAHGEAHAVHEHDPGADVHKPVWVSRILANLTVNSFLFMGVSALFVFLIALKFASNAGWHTQFLRVAEAYGHIFPVFAVILLILFLTSKSTLYHWTDPQAMATDVILQSKKWWLNEAFFLGRTVVFTGVWFWFFLQFRNMSREEDRVGGFQLYDKRIVKSAVFLIIFALSFSAMGWDWIMSIEAHWFSTMFGIRMFSTCWVTALGILTLTLIYLKGKGYYKYINDSHFHDLGKLIFAFSIFWAYIWFSEFMLIWYANISEEGIYFFRRFEFYKITFFVNIFLNFVTPFLILIYRGNMRHLPTLGFVCCVVIFGHWLDLYLCVMPGTVGPYGGFGFLELGMLLTFLGAFLWAGATFLTQAPLIAKNHPYLKESIYHNY